MILLFLHQVETLLILIEWDVSSFAEVCELGQRFEVVLEINWVSRHPKLLLCLSVCVPFIQAEWGL